MRRHSAIRAGLACAALLILSAPAWAAATVTYTYDALGRIIMATYSDGSSITYAYDSAGNRTSTQTVSANACPVVVTPLNGYIVLPLRC